MLLCRPTAYHHQSKAYHATATYKDQFLGQQVYVGVNVARRNWKVCVYLGQTHHKNFSQGP
jgi:hypothetical protein